MSRRKAREELFKLVFESELKNENTKDVFDSYLTRDKQAIDDIPMLEEEIIEVQEIDANVEMEALEEKTEEVKLIALDDRDMKFLEKYMTGIANHNDEIMEIINKSIVGWTFERIGAVEKSLLKSTVYELMFETTPCEIAINEAIELAKVYGDEKTAEFVNGVLAKVVKNIKK